MACKKFIHLYNVQAGDRVQVNGTLIKRRNSVIPKEKQVTDRLYVSFIRADFKEAIGIGHTDALDTLVADANAIRGKGIQENYVIYGLGGRNNLVSLEID